MMRKLSLALVIVLVPANAAAQMTDLTEPDPIALELFEVRTSQQIERREAGIVLLVGGVLSVVGGAIVAGIGYQDPFWLAFGLGSAAWGAVNAGLSIGMLDIGDGQLTRIRGDLSLRGEELAEAREGALRGQHGAATLFAFNFGLDFFYIASGVLLFFLADQLGGEEERELLRGYSVAMAGQGVFLFAFDLVEWLASSARADRVAAIDIPR